MRKTQSTVPCLMAAALLLFLPVVAHAAGGIKDDARFFSDDAIAKAQAQIAEIKTKYGKDLRIETYPGIPDDLRSKYSEDQKKEFFVRWAFARGKSEKVDGVMVLICRDPSYLQVEVGEQTARKAFTKADRDRMRDVMLKAFKEKDYDGGLQQAVQLFADTLAANTAGASNPQQPGASAAPAAPSNSTSPRPYNLPPQNTPGATRSTLSFGVILFWVIVIGGGLWLISRIFRGGTTYSGGGAPPGGNYPAGGYPPPGYGGGYGGGGGFGRGFGGGILGGLLGGWLGNQMYRRHEDANFSPGSAPPPTDTGGGGIFDNPSSTGGADFSGPGPTDFGGGGDFSSGSSGSDSGGGGDFGGGGDSGGGGGDSGGGGSF